MNGNSTSTFKVFAKDHICKSVDPEDFWIFFVILRGPCSAWEKISCTAQLHLLPLLNSVLKNSIFQWNSMYSLLIKRNTTKRTLLNVYLFMKVVCIVYWLIKQEWIRKEFKIFVFDENTTITGKKLLINQHNTFILFNQHKRILYWQYYDILKNSNLSHRD